MRRILVVDDQPHIVRVIRLSLERSGYAVDAAGNGAEALVRLAEQSYDVLITDIEMPVMDGLELCETMHTRVSGRKPITFIVTAKTDAALRERAQALSDTEFLEKPLSLRQLTAKLEARFASAT